MKSTAHIAGHPIHPMLIPFPLAFLSGAAAFDVLAAARQDDDLAATARQLGLAGLATAAVAAVPGLVDYFTIVRDEAPRRTATRHLAVNLGALGCFAAAAGVRRNRRPTGATIALELAGTALLVLGGWFGGKLSYHHQIGVVPEAPRPALSDRTAGRAVSRQIVDQPPHAGA